MVSMSSRCLPTPLHFRVGFPAEFATAVEHGVGVECAVSWRFVGRIFSPLTISLVCVGGSAQLTTAVVSAIGVKRAVLRRFARLPLLAVESLIARASRAAVFTATALRI